MSQISRSIARTIKKAQDRTQAKKAAAVEAAKAKSEATAQQKADYAASLKNVDTGSVSGRIKQAYGEAGFGDTRAQDIIKGAQFGEAVLGPEGLGRMQESDTLKAMEAQAAELAKGFSSEEYQARQERALEEIQGSTAASSRAAQAALARSGVKGMAAGQQLTNIAVGGLQARGNMQRDLMIANREAQMAGLKTQQGVESQIGELKAFNLSQAAKEKDIALQAGLGFAQMGVTERGAEANRTAQIAAAKASKPSSCHVAGTPIMMEDGSYKNIEDLQVGDELAFGGTLIGRAEMILTEDLYEIEGEIVTESHLILDENFEYIQACHYPGAKKVVTEHNMVYPLFTEHGCYFTSFLNGDFGMETQFKEERKCILDELMKQTKISLKSGSLN